MVLITTIKKSILTYYPNLRLYPRYQSNTTIIIPTTYHQCSSGIIHIVKNLFIVIVIIASFVLSGCSIGKYEGQTAEEWFADYNEAETSREVCSSKYEELVTAVQKLDLEIIELNKCVHSGDELDARLMKDCTKSYTQEQCFKMAVSLVEVRIKTKRDCVSEYLQK